MSQAEEIRKFSKDAPRWWDESGPFAPLHRLNPVRLSYIKEQICAHYKCDTKSFASFENLSVLDIGCGGGLVCEPMARLGANVTGIDADPVAVKVAQDHAALSCLDITYKNITAEAVTTKFDVVLALEIIEHVDCPNDFVATCASLLKPGGLIIFSTLNRTPRSFALGIAAAEYILRWVPQGTHRWKKFVKPSALTSAMRAGNLTPQNLSGLVFNPLKGCFVISKTDVAVNYFMTAAYFGP